jgi:hypothetical protein
MHLHACPLPRQCSWRSRLRRCAGELIVSFALILLFTTLVPQSAAARTALPRDRRSDREITIAQSRIQPPRRSTSGFAPRDRRPTSSSAPQTTNSGESAQPSSNKNDEQTPLRDTNLHLAR